MKIKTHQLLVKFSPEWLMLKNKSLKNKTLLCKPHVQIPWPSIVYVYDLYGKCHCMGLCLEH